MRLTLRTLLAYRDRVLSPADAEDLHRRIQISHDAGNLLRRISAVTGSNAVLAPPVLGKGLGGDANSIAEYLDDAMQHTQLPELERICLVSDMHLAELADCHSLLSTAAHTKVSVSSELRRMALALGDSNQRGQIEQEIENRKAPRRRGKQTDVMVRVDAAHVTTVPDVAKPKVPVQVQSPMLVSGGESIKPQGLNLETTALTHEVPDYLMNSSAGNWKIPLAIGALAAVLVMLVWQSLGPWEKVTELFAKIPVGDQSKNIVSRRIDLDVITETEQGPPGVASITPSPVVIDSDDAMPPGASANPIEESPIEEDIIVDMELGGPPGIDALAEAQSPQPATVQERDIESSTEAPPGNEADVAVELKAISDQGAQPDASRINSSAGSQAVWLPSDARAEQAVILWRDAGVWRRVEAGKPLPIGSRWVIPPSTRTTIDLPSGVLWTACGPSQLELASVGKDHADAEQATRIVTPLCRALVRGGPDGGALLLSTPVGDFKLELSQPNSLASVEMSYRPVEAGSIVDQQSTKPILIIVAAEESLRITRLDPNGSSEPQELSLGDGLACVAESQPIRFRLQNIPAWFRSSIERPIDGLAVADLSRATEKRTTDPKVLASDATQTETSTGGAELDIASKLIELSRSRRPESAALAVQVSLLCGNWHPLAAGFLDDVRMRSHWTPTLNLARQLLAAEPTAEVEARKSFTKAYAEAGTDLVDLMCGFPADQLDADALAKIVQRLESSQLAMRVLAVYQLQILTGKSLGIQPATISRSGVQQWRRELANNRSLLLPVPDPIWERAGK
ncbi:MAG: hypothetical protein KDA51_20520 [Planctomycetales bacterium]|nr:hypothetical protein [Planctomycetales bacterium]